MPPRHMELSMAYTSFYFNSLVFIFNLNKLSESKFGKEMCSGSSNVVCITADCLLELICTVGCKCASKYTCPSHVVGLSQAQVWRRWMRRTWTSTTTVRSALSSTAEAETTSQSITTLVLSRWRHEPTLTSNDLGGSIQWSYVFYIYII